VIVVLPRLDLPSLQALSYAQELHATSREAVTVAADPHSTGDLTDAWPHLATDMPLTVLDAPFRDITHPLLGHIRAVRGTHPRDLVTVVVPELVVGGYWQQQLHNQSAVVLLTHLNLIPGVVVVHVPPPAVAGSTGADPSPASRDRADHAVTPT
jgi:hypothetical protein